MSDKPADFDLHDILCLLITLVGAYTLTRLLFAFLIHSCKLVYAFILPGNVNLKKFGQWAVVTGCTEGIGKSYAVLLAQRGIDLVLISRNPEKLETLSNSLQQAYNVRTIVIVADFKCSDIYHRIRAGIQDLDICVLVNNVGVSYHRAGEFLEVDPEVHAKLVNINSLSFLMLTHIVLPGMLAKNKGAIINISSGVGYKPFALFATYSATKSLMTSFTKALQYEYRKSNVLIQLVAPLCVQTRLDFEMPRILAPLPDTYVQSALKSVGRLSETLGCLSHEIQYFSSDLLIPKVFDIDRKINYRICEDLKNKPLLRESYY